MEKPDRKTKSERLPIVCIVIYVWTAVSGLFYLLFTKIPAFSDWFNDHIGKVGRRILSYLTVWIPFSVAEILVLLLPILAVGLIVLAWRRYSRSLRASLCFAGKILSVLCVILILFVWCFAPGYYGVTLDRKLGLDRTAVEAEELFRTSLILREELNALAEDLEQDETGASVMPYSHTEMDKKLMSAYDAVCEKYSFPDHFRSRTKPVLCSSLLSYTHITGIYSFFTGEANINVDFPDYTIPFTAAHELAHQRGVAREDEANFVAFLVCISSDDPYIRYSGLLSVYEYTIDALYTADPVLYRASVAGLHDKIVSEERAFVEFFQKYKHNVAATVSDATNNAYLQSQGAKEGARSYNMVVDLTVAYYRDKNP